MNIKNILTVLAVAFVMVLTIRYIKVLPAVLKIITLGINILAIYIGIQTIKSNNNKNEEK